MKKKAMRKNLLRTIKGSLGRYAAIVAIIALGSAIFVGLIATKSDMVATGQSSMDEHNMFDLRLLSSYGWTQTQVDQVRLLPGVAEAEGCVSMDAIAKVGDSEKSAVYKLHAIPEKISTVNLLGGRMPESEDECLIDGYGMTDAILGVSFSVTEENDADTLGNLNSHTYTVVGYVSTTLYMDMSRGGTNLGNGNVAGYVYLPMDAFRVDYFTEIAVTMEGDFEIYSEEFNRAMENMAEKIEPEVILLADQRFAALKEEAEQTYGEGWVEYQDGLASFESSRDEALAALDEALRELQTGQAELDENRKALEDGLKELTDGQARLDEEKANLVAARQELLNSKSEVYAQLAAAYAELMENYKQVQDGLNQIGENLPLVEDGILQLEDGLTQIADGISQLDLVISLKQLQVNTLQEALDAVLSLPIVDDRLAAELRQQLADAQAELDKYNQQRQEAVEMQTRYTAQLEELKVQRDTLYATQSELLEAEKAIDLGLMELQNSQSQADNQFAAAEAQIESGQLQLDRAQAELDAGRQQLEDGMTALEEAQATLDGAWAEYETGRQEAEAELAEAEASLAEAARELADARETIDTMPEAQVFILDRNTNAGYLALDNNSDIVQGVSKVFPAFFLLIAALVCITTMTRMVEEERTQIGTLKALGYSNRAIIGKYIFYAGSAGIVGCGLGVIIGSVAFPIILWDAYGLILNITPRIRLLINWPLCIAVVTAYTAVVLLVTWYCCRRSLKEVAAELIRPKAPTSGKKIFLEYLFFWKKIGFLNKVMLRNVFRYRQRMLMMLIGIGGCTALLLTGFGLKDSVVNIVSDQFENVVTNDIGIYFSETQTKEDQNQFAQELRGDISDVFFFYQASADLEFDGQAKEIYMLAADEGIRDFMYFRQDGEDLGMPGLGETFLSVGVADMLGVKPGDTVTVRDAQLRELTVTVAGIYHNSVFNYAIVLPQTLEDQWGEAPGSQMAFLNIRDYGDVHQVGARIADMPDVMNVTINQDVAQQVTSMLDALNTVIVTIVICAGALAMIVLYNLTNINITERIREIATIKVLGFRAGETAAYVFKENLLLSAMGVVLGLLGGWYLLKFVMSEIRIDMVWFQPRLTVTSLILAMALTMLAACLVDFLLYFKLEKINMAEALKSVE